MDMAARVEPPPTHRVVASPCVDCGRPVYSRLRVDGSGSRKRRCVEHARAKARAWHLQHKRALGQEPAVRHMDRPCAWCGQPLGMAHFNATRHAECRRAHHRERERVARVAGLRPHRPKPPTVRTFHLTGACVVCGATFRIKCGTHKTCGQLACRQTYRRTWERAWKQARR